MAYPYPQCPVDDIDWIGGTATHNGGQTDPTDSETYLGVLVENDGPDALGFAYTCRACLAAVNAERVLDCAETKELKFAPLTHPDVTAP